MIYNTFAGAAALVYGAAKGIGQGVATEWARRGAHVAVADIDFEAAQVTVDAIVAAGGQAFALSVDVTSDTSVRDAAEAAEARLGDIDIVMYNVGGILNGHPEDIPLVEWQRIMDLNYIGAVRGLMPFIPKFLARGRGHIVTTASFAGLYPYAASRIPYAASKAAVIALAQSLALYLEPQGVRVTCFIPGPVLTGIMDTMTSWTENCPMRGPGKQLELKTVEEVVAKLTDAMEGGAVLVPSDDRAFDIMRRWAESPDDFLRDRMAEFESGETGTPSVPAAIAASLRAMAAREP